MNEKTIKNVLAELDKTNVGVFEAVFSPYLCRFLSNVVQDIEKFQSEHPNIECCIDSILYHFVGSVRTSLIEICIRTLISEIYLNQDDLKGDTPEEKYIFFINHYLGGSCGKIFSKYPEIERLVENRISLTAYAISEFFERFGNDISIIRDDLNIDVKRLNFVSIGDGDTHTEGRNVYILHLNDDEKVVYKPHPLNNDILYRDMICWMNSLPGIKHSLKYAKVIAMKGYGWQEFIDYNECMDQHEVSRYMYRLGCTLFVSYLVGCTDLHLENLIANGENPVIIDTETIFFNSSSFQGAIMQKADDWEKTLSESVFSSLLLPFDAVANKKLDYIDISGILGGDFESGHKHIKVEKIINEGTSNIRFFKEEEKIEILDNHNIPHLRGVNVHAGDYVDDIVSGFQDAYVSLLEHREDFLQLIKLLPLEKGEYRQILRNTSLYAKYLLASYHPKYLLTTEERKSLFTHLKGGKEFISQEHKKIVELEIKQLLRDDIPYFYALYDSLNLYSSYGEGVENFYNQTIAEQFNNRIAKLNTVDMYRQSYFIRCALAHNFQDDLPNEQFKLPFCVFSKQAETKNVAAEIIKGIYEFREKYHKLESSKDVGTHYYCISMSDGNRRLGVEPPDLYSGIGSVLFYIQLQRLFGNSYSQPAYSLVKELSNVNSTFVSTYSSTQKNIGLFTGMGSLLYLNYYAYKVYQKSEYLDQLEYLCDKIIADLDTYPEDTDVISGYAGIIIYSLKAWEKNPQMTNLYTIAVNCGSRLLKKYYAKQIHDQVGIAHGYAGVALSLLMLGNLTHQSCYYDAGMHLFRMEHRSYASQTSNENYNTTWCYGFAGLLVTRTLALDYVNEDDYVDMQRDAKLCLHYVVAGLKDISKQLQILCHGVAGNLDVLLWYAHKTQDANIMTLVERTTNDLVQNICQYGFRYELSVKAPDISFMRGLSGLGYYLERYIDNSIPSVLTFDVP